MTKEKEARTDEGCLLTSSHEIARRVLPFLSEKGLPVTPSNYRIWYEYFSGANQELKKTMDELLEAETEITLEMSESLYSRFFSEEVSQRRLQAIDQAGDRVQEMAVDMVKSLVLSITSAGDFNRKMGLRLEQIEQASSLADLQGTIEAVLKETAHGRPGGAQERSGKNEAGAVRSPE